jgi:demethylmenaquinone methyltransferase/2-methoxy-6-polyprenyl-1,4-benzoquinol methylase
MNQITTPQSDGSGAMFDSIAPRYDLLNKLMSFGLDRRWRRLLVDSLGDVAGAAVLDVATGTADIALAIARRFEHTRVIGLDPSAGMLAVGESKIAAVRLQSAALGERLSLVRGDAQAMPFDDDSFAASCIAFGIRNVPDRLRALREMARVTSRGGRVVVLELGEPDSGLLAPLARVHVHHLVPLLGGWLSSDEAYSYLQASIAAFPPPKEFAALMSAADLDVVSVRPLAWGAANLFVGEVR